MNLDAYIASLPVIQQMLPLDAAVYVADKEKFLSYLPGETINHGIAPGTVIPGTTATYECVQTGKKITKRVSKEAFGFSYQAICLPLQDEQGFTQGALTIAMSLNRGECNAK